MQKLICGYTKTNLMKWRYIAYRRIKGKSEISPSSEESDFIYLENARGPLARMRHS